MKNNFKIKMHFSFLVFSSNQVLKEQIPDECFNDKIEKSFLWDYVRSYFKDKPTSQKCLDYYEALLDSSQANILEVFIRKTFLITLITFFTLKSQSFSPLPNHFVLYSIYLVSH